MVEWELLQKYEKNENNANGNILTGVSLLFIRKVNYQGLESKFFKLTVLRICYNHFL